MADAVTTDPAGISRTTDGTITDGLNPNTTPAASTTNGGTTLLTEPAPPKTEPSTDVEKKKDEPKGAPEKYSDYIVPDGYTLDPEIKTEADALFKGMGLTQAQAQSLVDFFTSKTTEAFQAPYDAYKTMTDGWRSEAEGHPDLRGKLGPGQEVNVRISKALDALGDSKLVGDFKALMDLTGAGNNQAFIRVLDKLAQRVTEGTHVAGNGPVKDGQSAPGTPARPSAAAAIWPALKSS